MAAQTEHGDDTDFVERSLFQFMICMNKSAAVTIVTVLPAL